MAVTHYEEVSPIIESHLYQITIDSSIIDHLCLVLHCQS